MYLHKQTLHKIQKICGTCCLVAGLGLAIQGSENLHASIVQQTNDGSVLEEQRYVIEDQPVHSLRPADTELHAAAEYDATQSATAQLIFGLLFIIIGFLFHALFIMKNHAPLQDVATANTQQKGTRRTLEMYWLEK